MLPLTVSKGEVVVINTGSVRITVIGFDEQTSSVTLSAAVPIVGLDVNDAVAALGGEKEFTLREGESFTIRLGGDLIPVYVALDRGNENEPVLLKFDAPRRIPIYRESMHLRWMARQRPPTRRRPYALA